MESSCVTTSRPNNINLFYLKRKTTIQEEQKNIIYIKTAAILLMLEKKILL
jgi:hypothetical protein